MDWTAELRRIWTPGPNRVVTLSDEWWQARRGRLTASSRARSIAGPRAVGNFPKLKEKILAELRPDYVRPEQGNFAATEWGNKHERSALSNLELALGLDPDESFEPGFMLHPSRPYVGCTPDLLIDRMSEDRGLLIPAIAKPARRRHRTSVQVKCPHDPAIHEKTLLTKKLSNDQYRYQIQWEGWVSDADELLFVSYDPEQKRVERQLALVPIPIDLDLWRIFDERCDQFRDFVEGRVASSRPMDIDSLASYF